MTRVLVVDDDPNSQEVLTDILHFHNMEVQAVGSGEEALGCIESQTFHAIIIDLRLPGMDGWELQSRLQAKTDSPCVAITVYDSADVKNHAYEVGFAGYFVKPVNELTFGQDILKLIN